MLYGASRKAGVIARVAGVRKRLRQRRERRRILEVLRADPGRQWETLELFAACGFARYEMSPHFALNQLVRSGAVARESVVDGAPFQKHREYRAA
jgi:hypothetical protein